MDQLLAILGWAVYSGLALYAISGLASMYLVVRKGETVTQMGIFLWVIAIVCLIAFALNEWSKLHLLWIIPVGYVVSFTPVGRGIGNLVGFIIVFLFGRRQI